MKAQVGDLFNDLGPRVGPCQSGTLSRQRVRRGWGFKKKKIFSGLVIDCTKDGNQIKLELDFTSPIATKLSYELGLPFGLGA